MLERHQFYVDGEWTDPVAARPLEVIDPSTEEACASISLAGDADVDRAVAAARAAFPAWSAGRPEDRLALVERILEVYERRAQDMAKAISMEMGAPIDMSLAQQVDAGSWHIKRFIHAMKSFEFLRSAGERSPNTRIAYQPVGVAALITPWNWPMNQVTLKVIPALLAGCTMVLKPSEIAPLSSMLFAEMVDEAGAPAGVFNLVNGDGAGAGTRLSIHPDIDMVSFTGSTRAGIAITKAAADSQTKVCLELGGKGANLIFADAEPKLVERSVRRVFNNSGQSCNAPTRMLVERSIYADAVETARKVAEQTQVGSAHQPGKHIGPVVSAAQHDKIQDLIQSGIKEGARLVAGGPGRPSGLNKGYFVRPTVFADVEPGMRIEKEEIFGPVISILPFDSEAQAVTIANDTIYGLANYVQTADDERRKRVALALRAGMVETNSDPIGPDGFFGGVKSSGRAREGAHWGIEEFCDTKSISGWPS